MPTLSVAQIGKLASDAGVPASNVPTAVAIALAESGGRTDAHNPIGLDDSYGLWQINMRGALGPDRRRRFGLGSNAELFDPVVNARAMANISSGGTKWGDWTTYTGGRYLGFLPRVNSELGATTQPVGLPGVGSLVNLAKAIDTLTSKQTWVRVGLFGGGFLLLLVAMVKLTGDNKLSPLTKKVVKLVATRKVAK